MADNDVPRDKNWLTPVMVATVRAEVLKAIREDFPVPHGKKQYPGGQRAIAEALGFSQATLNTYFVNPDDNAKVKAFGIDVLLALRAYFRKRQRGPQTLDALLGLDQSAPMQVVPIEDVRRMLLAQGAPKIRRG